MVQGFYEAMMSSNFDHLEFVIFILGCDMEGSESRTPYGVAPEP
jgi:hypothetical protein